MITCKVEHHNDQIRIVAPELPNIGETVFIEGMGHALVEGLFHDFYDNYIKLEYQETALGKVSSEHRFSVE